MPREVIFALPSFQGWSPDCWSATQLDFLIYHCWWTWFETAKIETKFKYNVLIKNVLLIHQHQLELEKDLPWVANSWLEKLFLTGFWLTVQRQELERKMAAASRWQEVAPENDWTTPKQSQVNELFGLWILNVNYSVINGQIMVLPCDEFTGMKLDVAAGLNWFVLGGGTWGRKPCGKLCKGTLG